MTDLPRRRFLAMGAAATGAGAVPLLSPAVTAAAAVPAHGAPVSGPTKLATNKRIALTFYDALFNRGEIEVADRLARPDYIQHNPGAPDGVEAIKAGALGLRQAFPQAHFRFVRTLAHGDLVAIHTHFTLSPGDRGQATFDIYRLQDGRIAEHWDALQPVPTTSVSGNDMFSTLSPPRTPEPDPRAPRRVTSHIASAFYQQVFLRKDVTGFDRYARDYRQHNPFVADGAAAAQGALSAFYQANPHFEVHLKRVIVDGDLMLFHANMIATPGSLGNAVMDLFRVRAGKVVEHWDVVQAVPATSVNDNGMF